MHPEILQKTKGIARFPEIYMKTNDLLRSGGRRAKLCDRPSRTVSLCASQPAGGLGAVRSEKNYVPSRNLYENKENKVSGVRCKVSGCSSWLGSPGRRVRDVRSEKNYVPSRNLYENKNPSPKSEVGRPQRRVRRF